MEGIGLYSVLHWRATKVPGEAKGVNRGNHLTLLCFLNLTCCRGQSLSFLPDTSCCSSHWPFWRLHYRGSDLKLGFTFVHNHKPIALLSQGHFPQPQHCFSVHSGAPGKSGLVPLLSFSLTQIVYCFWQLGLLPFGHPHCWRDSLMPSIHCWSGSYTIRIHIRCQQRVLKT